MKKTLAILSTLLVLGLAGSITVRAVGPASAITTDDNFSGKIRGMKFEDYAGDRILNAGDTKRIAGSTIYLDENNNGAWDSGESFVITDQKGNYSFSNLPTGIYKVRAVDEPGWTQTYPTDGLRTILLVAGKASTKNNFGSFKLASISGMSFDDTNGNGEKDIGETGLAGWTMNLRKASFPYIVASTTTDVNGNYSFINLTSGNHRVREVEPDGWIQTTSDPPSVKVRSGTVSKGENNFGNYFDKK